MLHNQLEQLLFLTFNELQDLRKEYEDNILERRIIDTAIEMKQSKIIFETDKEKQEKMIQDEEDMKVVLEQIAKEGLSVEETIDKKRNYIKTRDLLKIKELAERPLKNEKEIKRVQINVLIWKLPQYEKECVNRIIDYTTHPYKLVCYDNRPNSFEGCNTAQIWNKLINESDCEYNLIMDSDAFIQRGQWLEKMVAALEENPNAAIIGPVSGFKNSGVPRYQEDYFVDGVPIEINDHISGFCFMIRRSLFKIIGPFDEDFYYFGQDSDWCNRVMEKGYKLLVHRGVQIVHGYPELKKWSMSSIESRDKEDLNWYLDSKYAGELVQRKIMLRKKNKYDYKYNKLRLLK